MAQYECGLCNYIYDETVGEPLMKIPKKTQWPDVPVSFKCPVCRMGKAYFDKKTLTT